MIDVALPALHNQHVIAVADGIRTICAVGAAVLIGLALALALRTSRHAEDMRAVSRDPQAARDVALLLLGFALLAFSALFTELGKLGAEVTWRLPFNALGIAVGLVAVVRLLRRARAAHR